MITARFNANDKRAFTQKINHFTKQVDSGLLRAVAAAGEVYYNKVIENIGTHPGNTPQSVAGYTWPALSEGWLKEKRDTGGITDMWAYTGEIRSSVRQTLSTSTSGWSSSFVGIDGSDNYSAYEKAIRNEFGLLGDIPGQSGLFGIGELGRHARPLFTPIANSMAVEFMTGNGVYHLFRNAVINAVRATWGA